MRWRCRSWASSLTGSTPIRKAVAAPCPESRTSCASSTTSGRRPKQIYEADRHAKKELKKRVRGVRPIERGVEGRDGPEAEVMRGYCLAVRSALTDDGRPPLCASGLKLHERLWAIRDSAQRVSKKGNESQGS